MESISYVDSRIAPGSNPTLTARILKIITFYCKLAFLYSLYPLESYRVGGEGAMRHPRLQNVIPSNQQLVKTIEQIVGNDGASMDPSSANAACDLWPRTWRRIHLCVRIWTRIQIPMAGVSCSDRHSSRDFVCPPGDG